jgi:hypothetical protein
MGAGVLNINIGVSPAGEILMLLSESTQTVYMTPKAAAAVVQGLQDAILKSQALEADTPQ